MSGAAVTPWAATRPSAKRLTASRHPLTTLPVDTGSLIGHHQPDPPDAGLAFAELEHAPALERFERRQPQPHPRAVAALADAVVGHLEHERPVAPAHPHAHPSWVGVLVGVAHRLGQD